VEEGLFMSNEPAGAIDQELELPNVAPNENGELSEGVKQALIAQLALELGIDPKYIILAKPVEESLDERRSLSGGLSLKITLLTDDPSSVLASLLANLTSSTSFWADVNNELAALDIPALDTSDMVVTAATKSCNNNFDYNGTESCTAVPISCEKGTFAGAGTGKCQHCPVGKFTDVEGASACESCGAGTFTANNKTISCNQCSIAKYQPGAGSTDCKTCPFGNTAPERDRSCPLL
jgi:hypothetical protein